MPTSLRVLIVEDKQDDAELLALELRRAGYAADWLRVDTEAAFLAGLDNKPDLILVDFALPEFSAFRALTLLQEQRNDTPTIVITGSLGDEQAVECIKKGASDYLLKDRLARLGKAVEHALEQKNHRDRDRLEKLRQELDHGIAWSLIRSATPDEANESILQTISAALGWEWSAVWGVDQQAQVLRCMVTWHQPNTAAPEFEALTRRLDFARGVGVPGRVWASGLPLSNPDITLDQESVRRSAAVKDGLHGVFAFPIRLGGAIVGVMEFFSREIREPDCRTLDLLDYLGGQIGMLITRSRAEKGLLESEARMRSIVDSALDAVVTMDHRGRIAGWNPQSELIFGYSRADALGRDLAATIIPERYREAHNGGIQRFFATGGGPFLGRRVEITALHRDGREFPVELSISAVQASGQTLFSAFVRDISERRQMQESLKNTNDQLTALVQASPMGITVLNAEGHVQLWNPAAERIFGWLESEVLGGPLPTVPPDKLEEHRALCRQVMDGRAITSAEVVRQRKDGSLIDISLSTSALTNKEGRAIGILGIMADITEHKLMERQAARLEELATLGQLLSGIAHELKNPLFVLSGRLQLAFEKLARREYDTVETDFKKIEDAAQRMTAITQRFLNFARPHDARKERKAINPLLEQTLEFLSNELMKNRIQLIKSLNQDLPPIWCDPRELQQVFTNLIMNAIYAMARTNGCGTLTISTIPREPGVEVRIQDDGPGIPPAHRTKLFDPFFTTKPVNEGTGLGLWIVKSLIVGMRGTVEVETEVGKGSTFIMRLPVLAREEPA